MVSFVNFKTLEMILSYKFSELIRNLNYDKSILTLLLDYCYFDIFATHLKFLNEKINTIAIVAHN